MQSHDCHMMSGSKWQLLTSAFLVVVAELLWQSCVQCLPQWVSRCRKRRKKQQQHTPAGDYTWPEPAAKIAVSKGKKWVILNIQIPSSQSTHHPTHRQSHLFTKYTHNCCPLPTHLCPEVFQSYEFGYPLGQLLIIIIGHFLSLHETHNKVNSHTTSLNFRYHNYNSGYWFCLISWFKKTHKLQHFFTFLETPHVHPLP